MKNLNSKIRARKFKILSYFDLEPVLKTLGWSFIGIKHDKDINADKEVKKTHMHYFIMFENACFNTSIAKQLGIEVRFVLKCDNDNDFLCYLTHFGSKDKFKYADEELVMSSSEMFDLVLKARDKHSGLRKSETDKISEILSYIDSGKCFSMRDLVAFALEKGYYSEFRRSFSIFYNILKEQREFYSTQIF